MQEEATEKVKEKHYEHGCVIKRTKEKKIQIKKQF